MMLRRTPMRLLLVPAAVAALAAFAIFACGGSSSNAFRTSYRSSLERWPSGEVSRLEHPSGRVEIVTTTDIDADSLRMMEHGYLLLGRSRFSGDKMDPDAAREVARDLGASTVFVKAEYARTVEEAIPMERWVPTRREPVPRAPTVSSVARPVQTSEIRGEFRTTYVKKPHDYFDFAATFWAKSKPPIFGVIVEANGAQGSQSSPSGEALAGKGVVVRAVIHDSPAERAGIQHEDVIVRFAGIDINSADQFFDTVVASKGQVVDVDLVRVADSKVLNLKVPLKNE
jgi:hypothetical protein